MEYEVIRSSRKTLAIQIRQGRVIVRSPKRTSDAQIEAFLLKNKAWIEKHLATAQEKQKETENLPRLTDADIRALADRAVEVISQRVAYYAPLVGVTYGRITIRNQRTRWGSCSKQGNLNFNCLLMLTPPEVIDSVVVHELCHRKQMNHSERFYAEVLRVFPEYRRWDKWLKENGNSLIARMPRKD